jgi:hypothetical protein
MVVQRRFWITRVVIPFAILLLGVAFGIFSLSQQFFVRSLICPTEKCDSVRVSTKVLQLSWGNTIPSILVIGTLGMHGSCLFTFSIPRSLTLKVQLLINMVVGQL